jgi:hypothetical protein
LVWRCERRAVGQAWPIGLRLSGTKECWAENEEKQLNLDYKFWATDMEFGDDVIDYKFPLLDYTWQMMCHNCMSREFPLVGYTNIVIEDNRIMI